MIPVHESLTHGFGVILVHGEMRVGEVDRAAHTLDLLDNVSAVLMRPIPAGVDELLAADFATRNTFGGKLLVDLRLRGDACMVGTQNPSRRATAHAHEAHERILNGIVHRMAHMQLARDVGRRNRDGAVAHALGTFVVIAASHLSSISCSMDAGS